MPVDANNIAAVVVDDDAVHNKTNYSETAFASKYIVYHIFIIHTIYIYIYYT